MKRYAVVVGLILAANVGCTKGSKSNDSGGAVAVPQLDGLALIHPKISAVAILALEKASQGDIDRVSPQGRLLKRIQRNDRQIEMINDQILKLEAEKKSVSAQHSRGYEQRLADRPQVPASRSILDLYRAGQKNKLTETQIKIVENFLDVQKKQNALIDEDYRLQFEIRDLGVWDTYIGSKRANLEAQLKKIRDESSLVEKEKSEHYSKIKTEDERVRQLKNQALEKAQIRSVEFEAKLNELTQRAVSIEKEIATLRYQIVNLKKDSAEAQNEVAKLGPEAKKSILEPLYASKKLALAKALNEGRPVNVTDLIDTLILRDSMAYGLDTDEDIKSRLQPLITGDPNASIETFKVNYEKNLAQTSHQGQSLVYNKKAITIAHPIRENKMQCYSGTNLFLTLNEMMKSPFQNLVVIFTDGHIFPGFISAKGGALNLTGVETTVEGKGLKNFGPTHEIEGRIRVFDNHQYLLTELFKGEIENFGDVYKEMLATVAKYGFNTDKFLPMETVSSSDSDTLNSSPLGFGIASVADGDQKRETVDFEENRMFRPQNNGVPAGEPEGAIRAAPVHEVMPCSSIEEMSENLAGMVYCRLEDGRRIHISEYLTRKDDFFDHMKIEISKLGMALKEREEKPRCEQESAALKQIREAYEIVKRFTMKLSVQIKRSDSWETTVKTIEKFGIASGGLKVFCVNDGSLKHCQMSSHRISINLRFVNGALTIFSIKEGNEIGFEYNSKNSIISYYDLGKKSYTSVTSSGTYGSEHYRYKDDNAHDNFKRTCPLGA